ncbi:protein RETICULATA-RELATED 4, chloroplastic-like [Carex rostrata]
MAAASSPLSSSLSSSSLGHFISNPHRPSPPSAFSIPVRSPLPSRFPSLSSLRLRLPPLPSLSNGSGNNGGKSNGSGNQGGGGGGGGDDEDDESGWEKNRDQALFVLANLGRSLDSLPLDLAEAVRDGKVTGEIITRFVNLEKSPLFRWLMNFGGFKERLLADDLFLAKVLMECGVGIFTKTAAEYQKRKENFVKELDFVIADVVMAIVADFMLVWLPAPTVSLRSSIAVGAGPIAKFFHGCPDNAFQVALAGRSYSLVQRIGAIVRNGSKLFVVGTASSLIGTGVTNALIKARKAVDKENAHEGEDIPIISTSVGYGVYMAVSSNLRYQILAGVIEQRMLEPLLHNNKALLSAMCFAVRTGNTFLGSLLWVDYARWVGIQ